MHEEGNKNNNKSGHCVSAWRQYRQTFGGGGWRQHGGGHGSLSATLHGLAWRSNSHRCTFPHCTLLLLLSLVSLFFFSLSALNIYKAPHIYINWIFWMRYEASEKRKIIIIICTCAVNAAALATIIFMSLTWALLAILLSLSLTLAAFIYLLFLFFFILRKLYDE